MTSTTTRRRGTRIGGAGFLLLTSVLTPIPAPAQESEPATLTLESAIAIARRENPAFQSRRNDADPAEWRVREAYGSFLPQVNTSLAMAYTGPGVQRIGTLDFGATPERYYSRYGLNLSYVLSGTTLFQLSSARANRAAVDARIDAAAFDLESAVTLQYMMALRARDGVEVTTRQLERSRQNLQLVSARVAAGAAAMVEQKQAEVQAGRDEAALIQARRLLREEELRLMEQLGTSYPQGIRLVSEFEIFEPDWTLEELLDRALARHPVLEAQRAAERSSRADVRQARSLYFPTVSLSAGWSGSSLQTGDEAYLIENARESWDNRRSSCETMNRISAGLSSPLPGYPQDCSSLVLTSEMQRRLLAENNVFPFDFTENPLSVNLTVSLPVFTGFTRQRQVEEADAALRDAAHQRRAEELRLRTAVTGALDDLESAYALVRIEARNLEVASEQLEMARQRYALGASSILELLDAQSSMQTAERDHLDAVYDFHTSLAALEAATGQHLRPEGR